MITYIFAVVILFLSAASAQFTPTCTERYAWIRNPTNCSEFWRCDNYLPKKMACPSNLILNTNLHVCVRRNGIYDDCNTPQLSRTIEERCAEEGPIIPHETECQLFYNCSLIYNYVPKFFSQHLDECRYPDLFDAETLTCRPFNQVRCGTRAEFKSACDYRRGKCGTAHCQACEVTCEGKPDGQQVYESRQWSPYYVVCDQGRSIEVGTCKKDETLNIARLFSPITNRCEPLYRIPRSRGGLAPTCESDGLFPDDNRCDVYSRCQDGSVVDVIVCPSGTVFDPEVQYCRRDTEFCGRCGRRCKDLP